MVIEYLGEVIDEEECERRLNEDYAKGSFLFHLCLWNTTGEFLLNGKSAVLGRWSE